MTEYRFTFNPHFQGHVHPFSSDPVSSKELVEGQMHLIASYTLFLHETGCMPDYTNYGFIEKRDAGQDWEEVDEDD